MCYRCYKTIIAESAVHKDRTRVLSERPRRDGKRTAESPFRHWIHSTEYGVAIPSSIRGLAKCWDAPWLGEMRGLPYESRVLYPYSILHPPSSMVHILLCRPYIWLKLRSSDDHLSTGSNIFGLALGSVDPYKYGVPKVY